jgi:hypothetical protein
MPATRTAYRLIYTGRRLSLDFGSSPMQDNVKYIGEC